MTLNEITPQEFGKRIAQALLDSSSSTAFYFVQQAVDDCTEFGVDWEEAEKLLRRISGKEGE